MNRESGDDVAYKVLFLGRHGQGYHNVAEEFYGTEAWDVRALSLSRARARVLMNF